MHEFVVVNWFACFDNVQSIDISLCDYGRYSRASRQHASRSLHRLLWGCFNLVELSLRDVDSFKVMFDPIQETARLYFWGNKSLTTLTIVCGDKACWTE